MSANVGDKCQAIIAVMETGKSMRKACEIVGIHPHTFSREIDKFPELCAQYVRARTIGHDVMADEIMALADAPVPELPGGGVDGAAVRQRQLQIDSRKWLLSKLAPKVYGDRLDVSVTDTRISISGALQAAQARLVDVVDVTPKAIE